MISFTKRAKIDAPADKVWAVFAHDFDNAYKWMASVPHSYAKANGEEFDGAKSAGRVCELDQGGIKASEKFLAYDEEAKTATVRIDFLDTPMVFPVKHNTLECSIVETEDGNSEMTWAFRSRIKPLAYLIWPLLRLGFGSFVGQIMEELVFYVENGTPHPRKLKANKKSELSASA